MANKTCPDCDDKVTKDDAECENCGDIICEGCMDDHAFDEAFPDG